MAHRLVAMPASPKFKPLARRAPATAARPGRALLRGRRRAIKEIERTTNHDVKAVEYWLKRKVEGDAELARAGGFMHFACTSEDINNTSHALMLKAARATGAAARARRPDRDAAARCAHELAGAADAVAHARPDGQPDHARQGNRQRRGAPAHARATASPPCELLGKMNGAVGNYNAHLAAYPEFDWEALRAQGGRAAPGPGLQPATRSRSSRTTTWPSCSTPSRAPTRS